MSYIHRKNISEDEIRLTEGKFLIETSKGEILYKQTNVKYWEHRNQVDKVAAHWTKQHAVYVHVYQMRDGFFKFVSSWVGGKVIKSEITT